MTDLLKEAIADAKAVREVALANAKIALEEAFTPRLQSMLSSKLSEEAEEDEEMTEGEDEEHMEEYMEGEEEEAPKMEEADEEHSEEMEEEYGSDEESMEEGEDSAEEPGDEIHEEEDEMEVEMEDEEEIDEDLMEIIRQLEEELDSSEIGTGDNKQPSKSASDDHTEMKKEKLVQLVNEEEEEEEKKVEEAKDEDEVDIQEILRALREEEEEEKVEEGEKEEDEMKEAKLQEAYAVIQFLREKLNEVNLLNSKLLFSNKLFRAHALTESQKITVIENFDRAKSLREVKLVYATLAESLKTTKVKQIKESFASKPVASTRPSKAILSESTVMADRLRKLAGLK